MRLALTITAFVSFVPEVLAQSPRKCVVCDAPLSVQFYWVTSPALLERVPVCEACSKLDTICAHCRLPVAKNVQMLDDGRLLCQRDYEAAIFKTTEALRVFEEAKRDAQRLLHGYGKLPDRNITVSLVNSNDLGKLNVALPGWHGTLLGLTRTRRLPGGQFQHSIFLMNGQTPARCGRFLRTDRL
jgi:hypothetical protein